MGRVDLLGMVWILDVDGRLGGDVMNLFSGGGVCFNVVYFGVVFKFWF